MKATITTALLLISISLSAQCTKDTTRYSSVYEWVMAMDKSYIAGQVETSPVAGLSIHSSAYPVVAFRHIQCTMEVILTTCGDISFTESRLIIPGDHNYEPLDWRIYPEETGFEEAQCPEPMEIPEYFIKKTSLR